MNGVLVCTACGSVSCWQGEMYCEEFRRADIAVCTCEWSPEFTAHPLVVHPDCPAHGEPS